MELRETDEGEIKSAASAVSISRIQEKYLYVAYIISEKLLNLLKIIQFNLDECE